MITTKKAHELRFAIETGKAIATNAYAFPTPWVMKLAKDALPRRYRKAMVDVYHRNR